ncbi:uncharacterized protein FSUBG_7597 [Fusarium subglutinans]|uniref:Uncharacterized protein n=1 Tax=Gibberella subglutinans TaxID=42677 RepID=A0A8H5PV04_GIBSU|nr:uncharacterized protein FSUBG_7597 [Fusarium subglutinans]KAF5602721.1 hypothetical protein FSUBG_7597 [Fusarium subglutinans]
MPDRARIKVEKESSRHKHEQRRWKPEQDLNRARENIRDLKKRIIEVEKKIDELIERKETLEEKNKKFRGIIQGQEGEKASREVIESASRQLQKSQNYSSGQGHKWNKLRDETSKLEAEKKDWETWKEDIEEECHRRAVFEARIRNEEPRSYESSKKSSHHPVR